MDPKVQEALGLLQRRTQEKEAEQDEINKRLERQLLQTQERNRKLESRLRKMNQINGGRRLTFSSDEEPEERDRSKGGRSRQTGEPRRPLSKGNDPDDVASDREGAEKKEGNEGPSQDNDDALSV